MGAGDIIHTPVKVEKLAPTAKLPTYGSAEAAGADLSASLDLPATIEPGQRLVVPTGIAIELLPGFEAQVRPRSGLAAKHGITIVNTPGTIDSDYRGEIKVILLNTGTEAFQIEPGDRIAQMVIAPVIRGAFAETDELGSSDRGTAGFGSTGVK
ncbi:dUTP diphosphatase [Shinella zoogloeoides]|uniref:dUTP diphosphatase n=1 Tax=Shinella zoogloeoides TaxID=352475 RepID=UPI00273CF74D|nr:dUTP diphosphatase [Shinella zoogloeoides]WLR90900.1 dUTP diphosphatase [Shinella zoogloeoides]